MRDLIVSILPKSAFVKNIGILTGGTIFAQSLAVLSLPILTRLFSPEDFSLLAVYTAIIGLFSVVSCMRLNIAIPMPADDSDAINLVALSLFSATTISALIAAVILLFPSEIVGLIHQPAMRPLLWMIPVGVFVAAIYNALQYWTSRRKQFGLITQTRVTRAIGGSGTQIGFGLFSSGPFGLLFGHMIYGGMGILGLVRSLLKNDGTLLTAINRLSLLANLRAYKRFPLLSVPESLFNSGGIQLPIIIIAAWAIGPEAGFVMIAIRVMGLPMGLVGTSVAQVYLAEAPEHLREGTLVMLTRETIWILFKSGAPILVLVGFISPFIFPYVFGAEWQRAGIIVAWMTPWFLFQFVSSPISVILYMVDKYELAMLLQLSGLILRVGSVLIAILYHPEWLTEAFAVSSAVFYLIFIILVTRILQSSERSAKVTETNALDGKNTS